MAKQSQYAILFQKKHDKISRINDLMDEIDILATQHVLSPEFDPGIGEWSPNKETGLVDAAQIEEEIGKLELEIREINKKLRYAKRLRQPV